MPRRHAGLLSGGEAWVERRNSNIPPPAPDLAGTPSAGEPVPRGSKGETAVWPSSDLLMPRVAHNLREPLRSIRLAIGFLREDRPGLDDATSRALERIDDLAARAHRQVDALVEYARVGQQELQLTAVDLNSIVAGIIGDLERFRTAAPGEVRVVGRLPSACGDQTMVGRAIAELVMNGLTFNRSEPRLIEIGTMTSDAPALFVRDNGIGIDRRSLDDMFRMFVRLHPHGEFGCGVGAGLAIARRIVERHGGRLWADSQPGAGSIFGVALPPIPCSGVGR